VVVVLAAVPSNVQGGSYMTFGGPVGLFVVVGAILWLLLFRPHRRVPPRQALASSQTGTGNVSTASAVTAEAASTGATTPASTGATAAGEATAADGDAEPQQDTSTEGTEASE
jgi:hypothetical protein